MDNSSSDISLISLKLSKLPPTLLNDPITNLYPQNGLWLDANYKKLGPSDFWETQNHLHKLVFRRALHWWTTLEYCVSCNFDDFSLKISPFKKNLLQFWPINFQKRSQSNIYILAFYKSPPPRLRFLKAFDFSVCACGKWVCTSEMCPQGYRDIDRMDEDDEEEEEEEGEDPEDDPDVQDIRWFWCEDSMWTWAVLSASSQTGKISLGGGVRLIYPVTDSGLKVRRSAYLEPASQWWKC